MGRCTAFCGVAGPSPACSAACGVAVGACRPAESDQRAPGDRTPGARPEAPVADTTSDRTFRGPSDSLRVLLDVPGQVRVGDRVPIRLRIENPTDRPIA